MACQYSSLVAPTEPPAAQRASRWIGGAAPSLDLESTCSLESWDWSTYTTPILTEDMNIAYGQSTALLESDMMLFQMDAAQYSDVQATTTQCTGCCLHDHLRTSGLHQDAQTTARTRPLYSTVLASTPGSIAMAPHHTGPHLASEQCSIVRTGASTREPNRGTDFSTVTSMGTARSRQKRGTYRCSHEGCEQHFVRQCDLKKHKRRKHAAVAERKHVCWECGRRFLYPKDLKRHARALHAQAQDPEASAGKVVSDTAARGIQEPGARQPTDFDLATEDLAVPYPAMGPTVGAPSDEDEALLRRFLENPAHEPSNAGSLATFEEVLPPSPADIVDTMELYPGLVVEPDCPATSRTPPFTVSRSVLADAVAFVRGDPLPRHESPASLLLWGFNQHASPDESFFQDEFPGMHFYQDSFTPGFGHAHEPIHRLDITCRSSVHPNRWRTRRRLRNPRTRLQCTPRGPRGQRRFSFPFLVLTVNISLARCCHGNILTAGFLLARYTHWFTLTAEFALVAIFYLVRLRGLTRSCFFYGRCGSFVLSR